jgi:hypothetical protein
MKNENNYSSPKTKKTFSFKPKNAKKNTENETTINNLTKKKEEEKNTIKENIESINVTMHPQQEKIQHKKLLYDKQKLKKNYSSSKNPKVKNLNNENLNKQKKIILNINDEKQNKKIKRPSTRESINKKIELNLNSSNSKNDFRKNNKEKLSSSFHSTKQIKPIHMKKDFYVPTVSASLISPKNKSNSNSLFENSFSSHSSIKSSGKGSLKFNEKRKMYIQKKYNLNQGNNNEIGRNKLGINFNYEKVLKDLNSITKELNNQNENNNIENDDEKELNVFGN